MKRAPAKKKRHTPEQREKTFKPTYFFGYGSLMTAEGVNQKCLRHIYKEEEVMQARLVGYERGMSGYFEQRNFYGLVAKKGARCNGVVFKIHTWREYRSLLRAEGATSGYRGQRTYWPIDVTRLIQSWVVPAKHRVIALVCKEDRTGKGRIEASYIRRCWKFAKMQGDDFAKEFLKTGGMEYNVEKLKRAVDAGKLKLR